MGKKWFFMFEYTCIMEQTYLKMINFCQICNILLFWTQFWENGSKYSFPSKKILSAGIFVTSRIYLTRVVVPNCAITFKPVPKSTVYIRCFSLCTDSTCSTFITIYIWHNISKLCYPEMSFFFIKLINYLYQFTISMC